MLVKIGSGLVDPAEVAALSVAGGPTGDVVVVHIRSSHHPMALFEDQWTETEAEAECARISSLVQDAVAIVERDRPDISSDGSVLRIPTAELEERLQASYNSGHSAGWDERSRNADPTRKIIVQMSVVEDMCREMIDNSGDPDLLGDGASFAGVSESEVVPLLARQYRDVMDNILGAVGVSVDWQA